MIASENVGERNRFAVRELLDLSLLAKRRIMCTHTQIFFPPKHTKHLVRDCPKYSTFKVFPFFFFF